jgi:aryl-alcohol dehydrogenase-like predicted oxidoreductase
LSIVQESLRILNRGKITGVLFHRNPKNDLEAFIKVLPTLIMRLKEMDLIEYGGLSAHYPDDVRYAIGEDQLEIIQVPTNIFDHRLLKIAPNGELDDKLVVARSIFLQGLFFLDPDKLTGALAGARQPLIRLREICRDHDLSIGQLSVAFVRDLPQVDCLVIGALTPAQIAENVSLVEQPSISDQLRKEILNIFSDIDHLIITPALWPN